MTKMSKPEGKLVQEVQTISKLLAGNLFSSTAGERSFSSAQRLKTWFTPRINDEKVLKNRRFEWSQAELRDFISDTTNDFM